jgi:hypothetical protein
MSEPGTTGPTTGTRHGLSCEPEATDYTEHTDASGEATDYTEHTDKNGGATDYTEHTDANGGPPLTEHTEVERALSREP